METALTRLFLLELSYAGQLEQMKRKLTSQFDFSAQQLYREVDGLALVQAPALEAGFGRPGPYWSRHYRFFRGGRELTVIREVFSPALERWLGPAQHTASLQIPTKATSGYN